MSNCESCIHSRFNNARKTWCKYSPSVTPAGDCGTNYNRYESIYTIEPPIVLGTRFYTPQMNDEQVVIAPMLLSIEEEE